MVLSAASEISAVPPNVTVFSAFIDLAYFFASAVLLLVARISGHLYLIASAPPHRPSGKLRP